LKISEILIELIVKRISHVKKTANRPYKKKDVLALAQLLKAIPESYTF